MEQEAALPPFLPLQLLFLLLALLLLVLLRGLAADLRRAAEAPGCRGPPSYPVIGCLVSFYRNRRRLLGWYTELLARSPTQTIVVRRLGARRTVVTASPENVEHILRTNFHNFPKGKPFTEILGDFLGRGIFNVDGELWRSQRKLASHEFSVRSLRDYAAMTLKEVVDGRLMPVLESLSVEGRTVDLQELLKRLSFNMICRVSLGTEVCSLEPSQPGSPLARAFDISSAICARRGAAPVSAIWRIKRRLGVGSERELKRAVDEVHASIGRLIRDRAERIFETGDRCSSSQSDLLSRLATAGYGEEVIRDTVISFIMAGRDTTSAAMTWLFWMLSRSQEAERELIREVDSAAAELDYDSLKELKFLTACLCEVMRLYPPVAWDSKHAVGDDVLPDGTPVRAGDRVTYFPYGMGRMEAIWGTDRFEFKPGRWFEGPPDGKPRGELKKVCPYRFPVFQAGPRDCIGKEMAFMQMKYVVASVMRRFEIRPVDRGDRVFVPLLTAHMAGGLPVQIRKRERPIAAPATSQWL
ncbi:cytochrome P450 94B3-like [Syzygium oleosum]|uniref:cytochrome P450 94B3-like n=1 Tax=Syzygium oleosum TaxID=219896 RepID=UPI0024BB6919|nr:cytochrome P450 94B3-like [Syzygium oleosum]